ncbi:sugar transporter [Acrasis kona]|uniref:Sugar transporter n=1 Tax=Acrasis kona TaxID=1008807 RepID=A0AAW2ZF79_9EUKA
MNGQADARTYQKALFMVGVATCGFVFCSIISDKIGRIPLLAISFLISGIVTCLVSVSDNETYVLVIATLASFSHTFPWSLIYTYTPEVYPTVVRTTGVGACSSFTRIAGGFSPLMITLYQLNRIPVYVIFGSVLVLASVLCIFLPYETLGKVLRDNIDEKDVLFSSAAKSRPSQAEPLIGSKEQNSAYISEEDLKVMNEDEDENRYMNMNTQGRGTRDDENVYEL